MKSFFCTLVLEDCMREKVTSSNKIITEASSHTLLTFKKNPNYRYYYYKVSVYNEMYHTASFSTACSTILCVCGNIMGVCV